MSISYLLHSADDEMLAYGARLKIDGLPIEISASRWPTIAELFEALKTTSDHRMSHTDDSPSFSITIESINSIPIPAIPPFKATSAPASYLQATGNLDSNSKPIWLSFHGDTDIMLSVIQRLTSICGPLAFFADCDGLPWFVFSENSWPQGTEQWQATT